MLSKRNRMLLGLLGLQMVLVLLFSLPTGEGGKSKQFFEGVTPEAVTRLTVATADGRSVSVKRQDKGWVVDASPNYPADRDKIENLLARFAGLRSDRLVAQTKEAHNRFQVGSRYGQKVTLALAAGGERTLYLGTAANYTTTHVRVEGDDGVYLVRDLAVWQMPVDEKFWWQREYVSVKPEEVQEIALTNKAGELRLFRDGKGWQASGAAQGLDQAKVQEFVAAVSRIALTDYLGQEDRPEYGLARPLATLVLATKAGKVTLAVGVKDEKAELGGSYVMKSSASPFYARGGSSVLAPVVERRLADLLAPATP